MEVGRIGRLTLTAGPASRFGTGQNLAERRPSRPGGQADLLGACPWGPEQSMARRPLPWVRCDVVGKQGGELTQQLT